MATETETSLVVIERSTAMDVFKDIGRVEGIIKQVRALATADVLDATTPAGRAEIKTLAVKIQRSKTYLDGIGKELVDDLKELPKQIDAARKLARDELDKLRDEVRKPLTDWEAEQDRIKREKEAAERAEQAKKEAVQILITGFTQAPLDAIGRPSSEIRNALESLTMAEPEPEFFGDRLEEAKAARIGAIEKLAHIAEQAEALEEQDRINHDRQVSELAAAKARRDAEQQVIDARLATERAERERYEAEQRATAAEARQRQTEADAATSAAKAAEDATRREQERGAAAKLADERAEAVRAANVEHRKKTNNAAVNCLVTHAGLNIEQARAVVVAISKQQVSHVTIAY